METIRKNVANSWSGKVEAILSKFSKTGSCVNRSKKHVIILFFPVNTITHEPLHLA